MDSSLLGEPVVIRASDIVIDSFVGHKDGSFELKASPEVIAQLARYAKKSGSFSIVLGSQPSSCMHFSWPEPGYDKMEKTDTETFYSADIKGPQTRSAYLQFSRREVKIYFWFSCWHKIEGTYSATFHEGSIILKMPATYEKTFLGMIGLA